MRFRLALVLMIYITFQLNCFGQAQSANIYIGLYDNFDKENLHSTLLRICSNYSIYTIFISNDQYPIIIQNETELNNFFENRILLLNPSYPNLNFELDTLLMLDTKKDFLGFDSDYQPEVKRKVDLCFFIPNASASKIIQDLIVKYYQIVGFGDIQKFDQNISVRIFSKEALEESLKILSQNSNTLPFYFETY